MSKIPPKSNINQQTQGICQVSSKLFPVSCNLDASSVMESATSVSSSAQGTAAWRAARAREDSATSIKASERLGANSPGAALEGGAPKPLNISLGEGLGGGYDHTEWGL